MKTIKCTLAVILALSLLLGGALSRPAYASDNLQNPGYEYYVLGNPDDVTPATSPGLLLMGGSTDVDDAMRWMIEKSGGGDFVILRAGGTDAYNPYIYDELGGVDSVETLTLTKERAAYDPFVIEKIKAADALFIAGGNQWDYVRDWKDTPVEDAIHFVAAKGAPVGGTSAGLAVLGEFVFSAQRGTITSFDALKNPYQPRITLARDFLSLPYLDNVITDSHFVPRDRMGRLLTFLARLLQDGWTSQARGIGVNEKTALAVEADGSAHLIGQGPLYFLQTTEMPQTIIQGKDLTFYNIEVYRLADPSASFDLGDWMGSGGISYSLSVVDGVIQSTQPGGGIY
jgi:cyanophycinase